jgi:hypothetical protein
MNNDNAMTGGCLCGAISYAVSAEPLMAGFCCCECCRVTSGSGHAFHAMVPEQAIAIHGKPKAYSWQADSGNTATSLFCADCGSPLFGKSTGMPGMMTLRVASLRDPSSISPQMVVYAKRKLPWDDLPSTVPAFQEMPSQS